MTHKSDHTRPILTSFAVAAALALTALPASAFTPLVGPSDVDAHCGRESVDTVVASDTVSTPNVIGPVTGGIRTQKPYGTTLEPLFNGYIEEEFFIGGTATAIAGETAQYRTRIVVRRPIDPTFFNGSVIFDWTNVTIPDDTDASWGPMQHMIMTRGYSYISVSAQRLAVEASPLALKQWDPVRYGSLNHPGDEFSYDIYSQAAEAALTATAMGDLAPCIERRLAIGASQSGSRMKTYINQVHETAGVFDGFQPQIASPSGVDRNGAPVLWVNSMSETSDVDGTPADSENFRLWELAGPAHTTQEYSGYTNAQLVHAHSNGLVDSYNREEANAWGYDQSPGACVSRNRYQVKFAWSAALVALDAWVRTGVAPEPMPRAARDVNGRMYDAHGNLLGGVRGPLLDVPIATYYGGDVPDGSGACGQVGGRTPLTGLTQVFDSATIAALYPTRQSYVSAFEAAVDDALAQGFMLPEGAQLLRSRLDLAADFVAAQSAPSMTSRLVR
ncbi:MAG: hypothetical protein ACI970_001091 [Myxococcota bacterium]|jgi:hypothetical protein